MKPIWPSYQRLELAQDFLKHLPVAFWQTGWLFMRHHGFIRASAMTYTTLLGVIPMLILVSVIAGSFGLLDLATETIPRLDEALGLGLPLENILPLLANAQSIELGTLGLFGSLGLLFTFIMSMSNLESNLNVVWRVFRNRGVLRMILVFTPFLFFFALLLFALSFGFAHVRDWSENFLTSGVLDGRISNWARAGIPVLFLNAWLGGSLFVLYWVIPFTRVNAWAAGLSTTVVLGLLQLFFLGFVQLQSGMFARFSLLYGSLGFIPLLMMLVYCAWALILAGNCLTFAVQNWQSTDRKTIRIPAMLQKFTHNTPLKGKKRR